MYSYAIGINSAMAIEIKVKLTKLNKLSAESIQLTQTDIVVFICLYNDHFYSTLEP